jgi:acetyltransferase-like isoleucine patch superfamily enzyme
MFYSESELKDFNFKYLGKNVLISKLASLYKTEQMSFADNCRIDDFCALSGEISIGKNVHVTVHCSLTASLSPIVIHDFAGLAAGCHVFSSMDDYSGDTLTNPTIPMEYKSITHGTVLISKHVLIGTASVVFPNLTIGEGCAIGAMTLVNKSTEPWGIYVGIPAKRIKDRSKKLLIQEQNFLSKNKNF